MKIILLIVFGDTIVEMDLGLMLSGEHNSVAVMKVDDPREFGVAEIAKDNHVVKMVEKPTMPKSKLGLGWG